METLQEEDTKTKKITQLLLNTPGACFLCLQDNERDDEEGDPVEDLNGGTIDLSTICRYLKINQCSLLLTSLENDGGFTGVDHLEQDLCKFSVNLCRKCLDLTRKLNDMIIELEKAKLMVNFHLHSFHKLLDGNDKEESLEWINLLGRMHANPNNSVEAKLVQLLREETRDKSFKILRKAEAAKPQVILLKCPSPPRPPPSLKGPYLFDPSTISGTSPSIKTLLSQLVTTCVIPSKKARKSKLYRCPYCTVILTHSKVAIHLICHHSDKLLSSYFPPPSLPPSEEICRQVLQTIVVDNSVKIQSSTQTPPRLGCHLCGITYSGSAPLKQHFVITHTKQLCQEIDNFVKQSQKSMTPNKTATKNPPSSEEDPDTMENFITNLLDSSLIIASKDDKNKNVKKSQCPYCESSMVHSRFRFGRHLASLHPDKLLAPFTTTSALDKLKNDNPNHFSQLCRKVLAMELTKAAKISATILGEAADGTSTKLCCHLCSTSRPYSDIRSLKYHLFVDHTSNLTEQLIKMQNMKVGILQDKQKKKTIIKKVKPVKKIVRSAEDKTCKICRTTFSEVTKLRRHQVTLHPDQLFLECKPGGMGDDQFMGNCKEIFRREVLEATCGKPGDKIYKCGYCPRGKTNYKGHDGLLMHLTFYHRGELEGKLKQVCGEGMEDDDIFIGGDLEVEDGGEDCMVMEEEDAGDFDVKPDIGELDVMLYPETVLDEEVISEVKIGKKDKQKKKVKRLRRSVEEKTCTICRQTFSKVGKLRNHRLTQHPDHVFLECKPSWMEEEQFRGKCKEVFGEEVKEATCGKSGSKVYKCGYCPEGKTSYKGQIDLVVHLAYQHRGEMEGKLKKSCEEKRLEDDNTFGGNLEDGGGGGDHMVMEKEESLKRIYGRTTEEKTCTICGTTFTKFGKLRVHLVNQHPDHVFSECKPGWMGEEQFRRNCKDVFGEEVKQATGYRKLGDKVFKCGYCPEGKTSYKGSVDLVMHLAYQHRREMEGKLEDYEKKRNSFSGGDMEGEEENGGGHVEMEEDESGLNMEPDVGSFHEILYPDMVLDERDDNEEGYQEADDNLDHLQQLYGYFEDEGAGDGGGDQDVMISNMTDEQLDLQDNQSEPPPPPPIIKMEVNEAIILDDY